MIVSKTVGNIYKYNGWQHYQYAIDYIDFEWYELDKRVLRKQTVAKREIAIQFQSGNHPLSDGDILALVDGTVIVARVKADECLAIFVSNSYELARICYEIGNYHAPLFIDEHDNQRLLLPRDKPLQLLLEKMGFEPIIVKARLIKPLSVAKGQN